MLLVCYPFVLSTILYVVQFPYTLQIRRLVIPKTPWLVEADWGLHKLFIAIIQYPLIYNKAHLCSMLVIPGDSPVKLAQ